MNSFDTEELVMPGEVSARQTAKGRLLVVATNLGLGGGAEEQVFQLCSRLKARGWVIRMLSMVALGVIPSEMEAIQISSLEMKRGFADPRSILRLVREIRRFSPDVVHSHMTHANLLSRAARPFAPVPVMISTLHGMKMHRVRGGSTWFREVGHRVTDFCADLTTTVCEAAVDSYVRDKAVPKAKIAALPNGVDTRIFKPDLQMRQSMRASLDLRDSFVWLAVGRFELPKNYFNMLEAFAASSRNSKVPPQLLICGSGSLEQQARDRARALGVEGLVRFLGVRRDIPAMMNAADAFVLSSDTEGLPMVLLQAAASGLPAVATDVGGNREVVLDGDTGFIAPPRSPEHLSDAMVRMMSLPLPARQRMGERGRAHIEEAFEIERIVDRWERVYGELLHSAKKKRGL